MRDGDARIKASDAMDRHVVRALERAPEFDVPVGFAARVVGQIPERSAAATTTVRYGPIATWISMAVLVLALVALGMRAADRTTFGVALEWILCVQLVGVAMWLSGVRNFSLLAMLRAEASIRS